MKNQSLNHATSNPLDRASTRSIAFATCASGMAALILQTLVFRTFFTVFEGNEWSVSLFFFSWLLWGAIGAGLARLLPVASRPVPPLSLLLTAYLPAACLQFYLASASRRMAGLTAFDSFSAFTILPGVLLANAPVSLVSGMLFVWLVQALGKADPQHPRSASRIYVWEALGSFAGGALVTLLLYVRQSSIRIALLTALLPAAACLSSGSSLRDARRHRQHLLPLAIGLLSLCALCTGADQRLTDLLDRRAWQSLLPGGQWTGSFTTAANRYRYGTYRGPFNVTAGTAVIETLPDRDQAERLLLLLLAQQPNAANILLIGPGLLPAAQALEQRVPPVHTVWMNPDAEYAEALLHHLPPNLRAPAPQAPRAPIRRALTDASQVYDAAVIHLSADDTVAHSTLFTPAFLQQIKNRLAPDGTLYLNIEIGANYMGRERTLAAASLYQSLSRCFRQVLIFPGDTPRLAASDASTFTDQPETLIHRLANACPDWSGAPPELLHDFCNPTRAEPLRRILEEETATHGPLITHTMTRPRLTLFSTLSMLRKAMPNMPDLTPPLPFLMSAVFPLLLLPLLLLLMRNVSVSHAPPASAPNALIFFAGFSGFALNYLLLILFQAVYGTLFLRIGWLCALFMIGLCAGGTLMIRLAARTARPRAARIQLGLYAAVCLLTVLLLHRPHPLLFDLLFLAAGASAAGFIPLAEDRLRQQGLSPLRIGRRIARHDHLGGAIAALLCGLLILPLIGMERLLLLLATAAAALLLPLCRHTEVPASTKEKRISPVSVLLLLTAAICAWLVYDVRHPSSRRKAPEPAPFVSATEAPDLPPPSAKPTPPPDTAGWIPRSLTLPDGRLFPFEERVDAARHERLFRFHTLPLAPLITGFNGPVPLRITLTEQAVLTDIDYLEHHETPAYFARAEKAARPLIGNSVSRANASSLPDAVTGATVTTKAIQESILTATEHFFALLAGQTPESPGPLDAAIPDAPLPGIPRRVNVREIRAMIERGELSDHPARFGENSGMPSK